MGHQIAPETILLEFVGILLSFPLKYTRVFDKLLKYPRKIYFLVKMVEGNCYFLHTYFEHYSRFYSYFGLNVPKK